MLAYNNFSWRDNSGINKSLSLTDIMLNEDIIIEAIHELSPNSAAGPDHAFSETQPKHKIYLTYG